VDVTNWVEISERRLTANYKALQAAAGGDVAVLAVLKANAYGHGAEVCAPVLARSGAEWLGVTDAAEGAAVRAALTAAAIEVERQPKVLVMSGLLADDARTVVQHGLTPVVWSRAQMEWLADAVERYGKGAPLAVHVEIDTGMARQGVAPGAELEETMGWLAGERRLRLDGVMTHFASTEVAGSRLTLTQEERFEAAMRQVAAAGLKPVWVHAGNSSTVDNQDDADGCSSVEWLGKLAASMGAKAMVRSGLGLYGYCLPIEVESGKAVPRVRPALSPVMAWKTRIIGLREIMPGDTVGYNGTFVAQKPMRLALLPAGYADGLRRELSGPSGHAGGWVMIRGQRAAIVGRVSMNLTTVDVTDMDAADVKVGDEVVLLGDGVTADDHARLAKTIAYEIVCAVRAGSRLV
jgi:alanine racemase